MTGVITLSLELELGWGMHDKVEYGHLSEARTEETHALHRLLNLADHKELPITFDVVGHLLQKSCNGTHSGPYSDNWWREDPGTNWEVNPQFYAPNLIREIQETEENHELATHTYSHLLAEETTSNQLDDDLSKVEEVHSEFGLPAPTSIVMPRHQDVKYSILSSHGIETIRRPIEEYEPSFSNRISKLQWLLTRNSPKSTLNRKGGILETTVTPHPSLTSVFLPSGQSAPHPVFSAFPRTVRQSLHRQYLINAVDQAAEDGSHIHLWTHIYNMANDAQWTPIKEGLAYLATRRNEGDIRLKRMDELTVADDNLTHAE